MTSHLELLLNTRAGSSLLDSTYGLPDLTELTHAMTAEGGTLAALITDAVRRHEPRLADLRVEAAPAAPGRLAFALRARLADGTPLRLRGRLGRGGRVSLHSENA